MLGWFRLYGMAAAASKVETTALKAICQKKSDCFKKKAAAASPSHFDGRAMLLPTQPQSHVLMLQLHCNTPSSRMSKELT